MCAVQIGAAAAATQLGSKLAQGKGLQWKDAGQALTTGLSTGLMASSAQNLLGIGKTPVVTPVGDATKSLSDVSWMNDMQINPKTWTSPLPWGSNWSSLGNQSFFKP